MTQRVLFVCTGNTCRSPMAAAVFQDLCCRGGRTQFEVDSAGLAAGEEQTVSLPAREALAERGLAPLRLGARRLTGRHVRAASLIVTMTGDQRDAILQRLPAARAKTVTLLSLLPGGPEQVSDPFGGDVAAYRACLELMTPALQSLYDRLAED